MNDYADAAQIAHDGGHVLVVAPPQNAHHILNEIATNLDYPTVTRSADSCTYGSGGTARVVNAPRALEGIRYDYAILDTTRLPERYQVEHVLEVSAAHARHRPTIVRVL